MSYANDMIDINKIRLGKFQPLETEFSPMEVGDSVKSMLQYFSDLK